MTGQIHLLTPPGPAAIAVVRIVGPAVRNFLTRHFSKGVEPGRPVHGDICDAAGDAIDDPVVVLSADGTSADVNLHGGPWVVRAFLDLCEGEHFEAHGATEEVLPEQAVDADDAIEALMLRHLPLATTEQAIRALLGQPERWRAFDAAQASVNALERMIADESLWWLLHPPRVAIVGLPNVGKSTLANQLFAQERSITADMPGTTRDWVGEIANVDGLSIVLVDTPGVRDTNDAIEAEAIERSRDVVRAADLVINVLDASDPGGQDRTLTPRPEAKRLKSRAGSIVVLNKSDRAAAWARSLPDAIRTVATTGDGIDALRQAIRSRFGCESFDRPHPRWWTHEQRQSLRQHLS